MTEYCHFLLESTDSLLKDITDIGYLSIILYVEDTIKGSHTHKDLANQILMQKSNRYLNIMDNYRVSEMRRRERIL